MGHGFRVLPNDVATKPNLRPQNPVIERTPEGQVGAPKKKNKNRNKNRNKNKPTDQTPTT